MFVDETKQYISLQEAAKYCNYSQEYLALRIRQGKLKGRKFARNWLTKKEWLEEYLQEIKRNNHSVIENDSQYISLQEAAKYCNYSQEYLALRIRQGKLKGRKFARNWLTKKEWLEEYLKSIREYNGNIVKNNLHCRSRENFIIASKEAFIPDDYNITRELIAEKNYLSDRINIKKLSLALISIICILFFSATIFSPSLFQKKEFGQKLTAITSREILQNTSETFLKYGQWLGSSIGHQFTKIKTYFAYILNPEKNPLVENENKGIVVVPSTENDQALKDKIKTSFSDEVKVELTDESSGIITPIFKEKEGEKYLYIMVPVNN